MSLTRQSSALPPPYLTFFRKWRVLLLRLFGAKVEWSSTVHPKVKLDYPWRLTMGAQSSLDAGVWVYGMAQITIGHNTCIGKNVYLITGSHDISTSDFKLIRRPISIGDNCWLTTGVTVLPGCIIGDYAVVAANSTVCRDVEPWTVVGGNPAKFIKKRVIKEASIEK